MVLEYGLICTMLGSVYSFDLTFNLMSIKNLGNIKKYSKFKYFKPIKLVYVCAIILYFKTAYILSKAHKWGFPGGAVVGNLPANAGDTGSSPGLGRAHMLRSNWAREPQLLSLRVWSLCSATREAAIVRGLRTAMKSGPRSPQLEKALAQKRKPNTARNE